MRPDAEDPPLSEREALMMAYVDDELDAPRRREFERRLAEDRDLAEEVADYQRLLDLSRSLEHLEPTDREMRRFRARLYNRTEWRLGWTLLVAGLAVLAALGLYELCTCSWPFVLKAAIVSTVAGAGLLLASTVRQKRRQSRLDRYRGVLR